MKLAVSFIFILFSFQIAQAIELHCVSDTKLDLRIEVLQVSPASVSNISIASPVEYVDALITDVYETTNTIFIEFVNLDTVSAFNIELDKDMAQSPSFSFSIFELGSPGSASMTHQFSCTAQ